MDLDSITIGGSSASASVGASASATHSISPRKVYRIDMEGTAMPLAGNGSSSTAVQRVYRKDSARLSLRWFGSQTCKARFVCGPITGKRRNARD